ncbi:MAG TPA: hypothetical protein G4O03_00625 [Dehalococcoidia bacterium]|jgi:hypothetical protein|nr:hypothetical protein [Dehalococcoidia bacterium]
MTMKSPQIERINKEMPQLPQLANDVLLLFDPVGDPSEKELRLLALLRSVVEGDVVVVKKKGEAVEIRRVLVDICRV